MTVFFWGPGFYGTHRIPFPVKIVKGHDEFCHKTLGLVTWLGSAFIGWPCGELSCIEDGVHEQN